MRKQKRVAAASTSPMSEEMPTDGEGEEQQVETFSVEESLTELSELVSECVWWAIRECLRVRKRYLVGVLAF